MSQDVAVPSQRDEIVVAPPPPEPEGRAPEGSLERWAQEARQAHLIAQSLAASSFVPESLRKKPEDVTVAILAGHEMGLQPMAAMRSIDVIFGNPALRATAMRGLLQSRGHSIQLVESTDDRCVMRGRRKGEAEWQEVEWTIERATRLGLVGKDQWKKQPRTMLIARATGEICRLVASDLLQAMPYNAEETADDHDEPPSPPRATAGAIASQGVTPPAAGGNPASTPEPEAKPRRERKASQAQRGKIHQLATALGISTAADDRDLYVGILSEIACRDVSSSTELTSTEAGWVIEKWTKQAAEAPTTPSEQGEPATPDEAVDAEIVTDTVPGGDPDYWNRLVQGAAARGFSEAQVRAGLEQHYAQPVEDLTKEEIQVFTTKVALGTATLPEAPGA